MSPKIRIPQSAPREVEDLDALAERILEEEHPVEHRGRSHPNCPTCRAEGVGIAWEEPGKPIKGRPIRAPKWVAPLRENPGRWAKVETRDDPDRARNRAWWLRKRPWAADLEIVSRRGAIFARVRPSS